MYLIYILKQIFGLFKTNKKTLYSGGQFYKEGRVSTIFEKKNGICSLYHPNGSLFVKGSYTDGECNDGVWTYYSENGNIRKEGNLKSQCKDGVWKYFHENGQLDHEKNFVAGKREDGLMKYFNKSGGLSSEGYIKSERPDGLWRFYHEDGSLSYEGNYKSGLSEGVWKWYDENGLLSEERTCNASELVSKKYYYQGNYKGKSTYKYDEHGNRVEKCYYDSEGTFNWKETKKFNEEGHLVEKIIYDSDGIKESLCRGEWLIEGYVRDDIRTIYHKNGKVKSVKHLGHPEKSTIFDRDHSQVRRLDASSGINVDVYKYGRRLSDTE